MNLNRLQRWAQPVLCVSMSLVFLFFGFSQITSPDRWAGFVPSFVTPNSITPTNIVMINGVLELTLGVFLLIGLYTRFSALVLSLHLLGIAVSIGFSPLGVRDFGLAAATFVIFLQGAHHYSIDNWSQRSRNRASEPPHARG